MLTPEARPCSSILDRIDAIRKVPDQVRKYLKSNHFVSAARLIADTLRALEVRKVYLLFLFVFLCLCVSTSNFNCGRSTRTSLRFASSGA